MQDDSQVKTLAMNDPVQLGATAQMTEGDDNSFLQAVLPNHSQRSSVEYRRQADALASTHVSGLPPMEMSPFEVGEEVIVG